MSRYEAIKVPILKVHEYLIWKVRMAMCLEATDPEYLNKIYDGPHKPMKVVVFLAGEPERMIDKDRKDYSPEDISSIMKDAKVRHILHSILDSVISNSVIGCKTTKEIWDALEKLMNDLSLVDKENDLEDSNLKFLLALLEKWDYKVTSMRDNYELNDTPLDEIYGIPKTHELEMGKRSKRKGSKARPVAIKVEEKPKEKARRKSYSKGKTMIANDHNNNEDMEQIAALLVKSFRKMVHKNFKKGRRFSRKGSSSLNSDKSNSRRNTDEKESRSRKLDKSKERCYNRDGIGHFAADCRKPRAEKKQALISRKRNWDDSSDSDDGVNYALMEKGDAKDDNTELKEILENGCWGSGLGYSASSNSDKKSRKETEIIEPVKTDSKVKLNKVQIKTIKFNPSANTVKSIHEEGTTSAPRSTLITEKSEQVHTNSVNTGSMTQKQLKQKLKDLHMKDKRKRSSKNRNGKVGVNKNGNYVTPPNTSRKTSSNCGSTNHLANSSLVAGLKHNLISVSQICDRGYHVNFYEEHCEIVSKSNGKITLTGIRHGSLYEARVSTSIDNSKVCLLSRASLEDSWNWHKRLSHLNFNNINELVKKDLIRGLTNAFFTPDGLCDSCQKARQRKTSFKSKTESSILEPYHLLHVDLFGPVNVMSISKNRSDNGTKLKYNSVEEFCKLKGIKQEFSAPRTPQQNGVVERKNRTLIEAARTMLEEARLPTSGLRLCKLLALHKMQH
ncbi:hypothetical protein AgCh_025203 [Apium graveolens]